jgi:hypothetical protein
MQEILNTRVDDSVLRARIVDNTTDLGNVAIV